MTYCVIIVIIVKWSILCRLAHPTPAIKGPCMRFSRISSSNSNIVMSDGQVWINGKKIDTNNLPDAKPETHKVQDFNFSDSVKSLNIDTVNADVSIKSQASTGVSVHIEGPESLVDQVSVKSIGSEVLIGESSQSSTTIVSDGNVSISNFNGHISMNSVQTDSNDDRPLKITVTKPHSTDITVDASGMSKLKIDSAAGEFNVTASGMSAITADTLSGNVDIDASGMSRLKIGKDSGIKTLKINASGMSTVNVRGQAQTARLKSSGMAKIAVNSVDQLLSRKSSGMSDIVVERSR